MNVSMGKFACSLVFNQSMYFGHKNITTLDTNTVKNVFVYSYRFMILLGCLMLDLMLIGTVTILIYPYFQ